MSINQDVGTNDILPSGGREIHSQSIKQTKNQKYYTKTQTVLSATGFFDVIPLKNKDPPFPYSKKNAPNVIIDQNIKAKHDLPN